MRTTIRRGNPWGLVLAGILVAAGTAGAQGRFASVAPAAPGIRGYHGNDWHGSILDPHRHEAGGVFRGPLHRHQAGAAYGDHGHNGDYLTYGRFATPEGWSEAGFYRTFPFRQGFYARPPVPPVDYRTRPGSLGFGFDIEDQ